MPTIPNGQGYQHYSDQFVAYRENDSSLPVQPVIESNNNFVATFSGPILFDSTDSTDELMNAFAGNLVMAVEFNASTNRVQGEITHIFDNEENALTGKIKLENGQIHTDTDPNLNYAFTARLSGTLEQSTGVSVGVQGGLEGDFLGEDYGHAVGSSFLSTEEKSYIGRFSTMR